MRPVDIAMVLHCPSPDQRGGAGEDRAFVTRGREMVDKLVRGVERYVPAAQSIHLWTNHPDAETVPGVITHRLRVPESVSGWWAKMNVLDPAAPGRTCDRMLYVDIDNVLGPAALTPLTDLPLACDQPGAPVMYMPDDRVVAGQLNASTYLMDMTCHAFWRLYADFWTDPKDMIYANPPFGCTGARGAGGDQPLFADYAGLERIGVMQEHLPAGFIGHAKMDLLNPHFDWSTVGMMVGWWNRDPITMSDHPYYRSQWT